MAGPTAGHAEIELSVDGGHLENQIRYIGKLMAEEFGKEFDKRLTPAFERLNKQLDQVNQNLGRVRGSSARADQGIKKLSKSIDHQAGLWKRLSANTRQWTLIIAAVAAGGEGIATLGSALGPGLLTLGSAFTSLGIAGGTAIAVFKGLNGELEDLPAAVRPAAAAFQRIGDAFDELQDAIQVAALENAEDAFDSIADTVKQLTPAFEKVGKAIGRVIDQFAKGIAPGTKNFQNLNKVIEDSADVFEDVMRVVGKFGEALLNVFASDAATKSVQDLVGWMEKLADAFLKFTESDQLGVWFARASAVFGALGRLLEATGSALAGLVDDAAVGRLVGFLDNLTGFMPSLERLLSILGELDLFGILAQLLNDFGNALKPLTEPLEDLAGAISNIVKIAIDEWAADLGGAAEIAAPMVQALADALNDLSPEQIRGIADALLALAGAALILSGGKGLGKLVGVLGTFVTRIKGIGKAGAIGGALGGALAGGISQAGNDAESTAEYVGAKLGDGLLGALTGVMIGGGWGAIAGFVIGGISSVLSDTEALIENWTIPVFGEAVGAKIRESLASFGEGDITAGLAQYAEAIGIWAGELIASIGEWLAPAETAITTPFAAVGQWFTDLWTGITEGINGFFTWWIGFWTMLFEPVWAVLGPVVATFAAFFQGMFDTIATIWNGMATIISGVWNVIAGIITLGVQTVAFFWNLAWQAISAVFTTIWNAILAFIGPIVNAIVTVIRVVVEGVSAWWNGVWSAISGFFMSVWNQILSFIVPIITRIVGFLRSAFDGISSWWNSLWSGLASFFATVWNGMERAAKNAINGIIDVLNNLLDPIQEVAAALKNLSGGAINVNIPNLPKLAAGGVVAGPMRALIGEAGPEAVIPLTRPLSLVDPSVRPIAAFARGEMASGGIAGGGKTVTVMPGAIVIQSSINPVNTATAVLDRIVSRL